METQDRSERLAADIVALIPALRAFARRFHTYGGDADDLVQETMAKALSNLEKFQDGTQLKSWLFTIMRNAFCSRYATQRREAPGVVECVADERVVPPAQEWTVLAREVDQACNAMPEYYRSVLDRIVIQGQSYESVALELGCAVGTVKSRLNRARNHILAQFGSLDS